MTSVRTLNRSALVTAYSVNGAAAHEIASQLGVSTWFVRKELHRYDIPVRNPGHKRCADILSIHQKEVIEGELLGDGSVSISKGYKNARFQWGGLSHDLGAYLHDMLGNFGSYSKIDVKPNRKLPFWKITSKAAVAFTELHAKWYPCGKKIFPDIAITPTILLHWYMGDGYLKVRQGRQSAIRLSTQCFDDASLSLMVSRLNEVGLHAKPEKNNAGYVLVFPVIDTSPFFEFIGRCPIPYFDYKWPSQPQAQH